MIASQVKHPSFSASFPIRKTRFGQDGSPDAPQKAASSVRGIRFTMPDGSEPTQEILDAIEIGRQLGEEGKQEAYELGKKHGGGGVSKWWRRFGIFSTVWIFSLGTLSGTGSYITDNGGKVAGTAALVKNMLTDPLATTADIGVRGAKGLGNEARDGAASVFHGFSDIGEDDATVKLGPIEAAGEFETVDGLDGDSNVKGYGTAVVNKEEFKLLVASSHGADSSGNFLQDRLDDLGDAIGTENEDLKSVDGFQILVHHDDHAYIADVTVLAGNTDHDGSFLLSFRVLDDRQSDDTIKELQDKEVSAQKD